MFKNKLQILGLSILLLSSCAIATKPTNIALNQCSTTAENKVKLRIALIVNDELRIAFLQHRWEKHVVNFSSSAMARSEFGETITSLLLTGLSCEFEKVDVYADIGGIKEYSDYDVILTPNMSASSSFDGKNMAASVRIQLRIQDAGSKYLPTELVFTSDSSNIDGNKICGPDTIDVLKWSKGVLKIQDDFHDFSDVLNIVVGNAICNAYNPLMAETMANEKLRILATVKAEERASPSEFSSAFLSMPGIELKGQDVKYSKNPFKAIQDLTQKKIDQYLAPRTVLDVNSKVPPEIKKPKLPLAPNLVKSEFETRSDFDQRVSKTMAERDVLIKGLQEKYRQDVESRNKRIEQLRQAYLMDVDALKKEQVDKKTKLPERILAFTHEAFLQVMGSPVMENPVYDAETETMQVDFKMSNADYKKRVDLKVPRAYAQVFHANISKAVPFAIFTIEENAIKLKEIKAQYDLKTYTAKLTEKQYQPEKLEVVLKDTKVDFKADAQANLKLQNPNLTDTYRVSAITTGDSASAYGKKYNDDLTPLIKSYQPKPVDPRKWLFMIAVEHYNETDAVTFAKNSAEAFRDTAQKVLGIDEKNTIELIDDKATSGAILDQLDYFLKERVKTGDTIYFYYAGHGVPEPSSGVSYLLPKDKIPDYISKDERFKLTAIYKQLNDSKASRIVAFIDACFSGRTDIGQMYKGTAASIMPSKKVAFDDSKMTIFSAAKDNQFANAFDEKGHRMFSYFLMKSLLTRDVDDFDALSREVSLKVHDETSSKGAARLQDPQLDGNKKLGI